MLLEKGNLLPQGKMIQEYLDGLNACFGHWGDIVDYKWALERSFNGYNPDRLIWRDEAGVNAGGTGISYRSIRIGDAKPMDVGVMTGSWTMPSFRGQGIFKSAIEKSLERVYALGMSGLLAFVTIDNPSAKALISAGSLLVPSQYNFCAPLPENQINWDYATGFQVLTPAETIEVARRQYYANQGKIHFHYANSDDLAWQMLSRPQPTFGVRIGNCRAILEFAPKDLRILCIEPTEDKLEALDTLRHIAATTQRKLFFYSSHKEVYQNFEKKDGYITILAPPDSKLAVMALSKDSWSIESGDRI